MAETVAATFLGGLKARLIRAAARRLRNLAGLRESPKFYIIRKMGIIRAGLLESGQALVDAGVLDQPDDLFYFYLNELDALAAGDTRDWRVLAAERRHLRLACPSTRVGRTGLTGEPWDGGRGSRPRRKPRTNRRRSRPRSTKLPRPKRIEPKATRATLRAKKQAMKKQVILPRTVIANPI